MDNKTLFSTRDFVETWSKSYERKNTPLPIPVGKLDTNNKIYAVQTNLKFGLRYISLGPAGLYASIDDVSLSDKSIIKNIVDGLKTIGTGIFVWNVRFDDQLLASNLTSLGLKFQRTVTHILPLQNNYEFTFANYNSTNRNLVRKANREGITVRAAVTIEDVSAYHQIHTKLFAQKGINNSPYPLELLFNLINNNSYAQLLIAEYKNNIIAGGFFFKDGNSIFYWQGAADRKYSKLSPSCAIIDKAIQWGFSINAAFVNFGSSADITSLERYKSSWGAAPEMNWNFKWINPLLMPFMYIRKRVLQNA